MPLPLAALARAGGALALCIAIAACGGEDTMGVDPVATIGAGETEFAALGDGETAFVILGPQGGYHIIGSVKVFGVDPGDPDDLGAPNNPTTTFTVEMGGTKLDAGGARYTQGLDASAGGGFEMVGRIVILDILSDDEIAGATIDFQVTVVDADGVTASDEVSVVAMPDPRNP